jgi:hypothetical protein
MQPSRKIIVVAALLGTLALLLSVASPSDLAFRAPTAVPPCQFNCGIGLGGMHSLVSGVRNTRAVEPAPPPRPVVVGVHLTHIGGRRVPMGAILVTDRLKEDDLKPHIAKYQRADRSDELIAVKLVDKQYLRTISDLLARLEREAKFPEKAVVRVVLIWGDAHREYYLTPEEARSVYKAAIKATKDEGLIECLQYHLKLFDC